MAANRDGNRQAGDVRRIPLDMDGQRRGRAAELRTDASLVDRVFHRLLQVRS